MDRTRSGLDRIWVCVLTEQNLNSLVQQNLFGLIADVGQQLGVCQLHSGVDQNHLEARSLTGFTFQKLLNNTTPE